MPLSDRELDALVAQARGWDVDPNPYGEDGRGLWILTKGHVRPLEEWRPSESIAAAWTLVEELGPERMTKALRDLYGYGGEDAEYLTLLRLLTPGAPRELCLAYLKAKGVEVPA